MSTYSFRPVEESDLDFLADHRNEAEVRSNLTSPLPVFKHKQKEWLNALGTDRFYFIGCYDDEPISLLRLTDVDWVNRNAAVGLDVFKAYRGEHHARLVLATLIKYCFDELNLHRLWLSVRAGNEKAISVYQRLGFEHEGVQRQHFFYKGRYVDYLMMSLLEEEWNDTAL